MANLFVNIPVPTSNAAGAAVDVSAMGRTKSLVIGGGFHATVNVEYATDETGTDWAPLATFLQAGNLTIDVAARWLRAVTSSYVSGTPNLDAGGSDAATVFAVLTADGASVDVSALPLFKTVVVPPGFIGRVEASEDGTTWAQIFSFAVLQPNGASREFAAQYARVIGGVDGTPVDVAICGASNDDGGAAGSTWIYNVLGSATQTDYPGGSDVELYRTGDLGTPGNPPKPTEDLTLDLRAWFQIQWDAGGLDQVVDVTLRVMFYYGGGAALRTLGRYVYTPPDGTELTAGKAIIYCQGIMTNGHYSVDPAPMSMRLVTAVGSQTVYIPAYGVDPSYPYAGLTISTVDSANTHERRAQDP